MSRKTPIPPAQLAEERRKRGAGRATAGLREPMIEHVGWSVQVNRASQLWLERRGLVNEAFRYGYR